MLVDNFNIKIQKTVMIQSKQILKKTVTFQYNQQGFSPIRSNKTPIAKNINHQPNDRCLSPFRRSPTPTKQSKNRFNRTPNKSSKSPINRTPTKNQQASFIRLQYLSGKPNNSPQPAQTNSNSKLFHKLMSNIGKNTHSNTDKKQNINVFSLLSGDPAFMRSTVNPDYYNSKTNEGNSCLKQKSTKMPSFSALINNIDAGDNNWCKNKNEQGTNLKKVPKINFIQKNNLNQNSILSKLRKNANSHRPVLQEMSEEPQLMRRGSEIIPQILDKPQNAFKYFSVMHQIHGQAEHLESSITKGKQQKPCLILKSQPGKSKTLQCKTQEKKIKPMQSIQQDFSDVMFLLNKVQEPDNKNQPRNKITDVNISNSISNAESLNMDF